jgi:rubrerythrin
MRPNETRLKKLNINMIKPEENLLITFFDNFKKLRESTNPDEFLTESQCVKRTKLTRHILKKLVQDGLIRTNEENKFFYPDAKAVASFLNYFERAKDVEILKETDITGSKKYLMLDFQQNKLGKSLSDYQLELLIKMTSDFIKYIPDLKEELGFFIPKNTTKEQAQKLLDEFYNQ